MCYYYSFQINFKFNNNKRTRNKWILSISKNNIQSRYISKIIFNPNIFQNEYIPDIFQIHFKFNNKDHLTFSIMILIIYFKKSYSISIYFKFIFYYIFKFNNKEHLTFSIMILSISNIIFNPDISRFKS